MSKSQKIRVGPRLTQPSGRVWFDDLLSKSVDSYDDLKKAFLANFLQQKKRIKDPVEIHHIKQKEGESTKDFVKRFKVESRHVKGALERGGSFQLGTKENALGVEATGSWEKQNFERRGDFRNQQGLERRRDKFTLLIKSPKEILALDKGKFKTPPPMTTLVEKGNNNKFSEFHREVGHNIDECMHLRRKIEELIKAGKLSHRVARQRITQSFSPNPEISFSPLEDEDGTEDPMIIEAEIGGHFTHRIYVDGGSASEILYEHCFNRIRPKHSTSTWMNFVVVRSPSLYNGIIGRPGVRKIQAVLSTAHEMLKFPVPEGILTLRSSRIILLECTMVSKPEARPSSITQALEERIRIVIHPKYPE
nr:reverse transcriptase domain-containing protein [Tanacetum cinerariifolium]